MKIENNNLSEEAYQIRLLDNEIEELSNLINALDMKMTVFRNRRLQLLERKKSLLNYLNTDNN